MKRLLFATLLAAMPIYAQTTPNLKLNLPVFSRPGWAPLLNANFTSLDQYLSGAKPLPSITLSGPITGSTQAATKAYVDAAVVGGCGFCITHLTGDVAASGGGTVSATVHGINGVLLSSLATGILKVTAGVPSIAVAGTDFLKPSNNLSDLPSASTARTNLGLGTSATQASSAFDAAGAAAAAQTAAQTFASNASNLTSGTVSASRIPTLNQSTTGNAATATALAVTPSKCSSGQAAGGILANGNATQCFTPAGGSPMVYPGAGIPNSTGTAWGTSFAAPASALVGMFDAQTITNKTVDGVSPATFAFIDPTSSIQTQLNGKQASLGFTAVPNTTTINGYALASNVVVTASDLTTGTLPHAQLPTLLSADIPNNAANTSGLAGGISGLQAANTVYAAPNGTSGLLAARPLVAADIPALSYQAPLTLTTSGTSGPATLIGSTLNVPSYSPGGGSMVYPSGSGIPIVVSGTSWGTTVAAPAGAIVGTTDTQTLTNKSIAASQLTGTSLPITFSSAGGLTTVAGGTFGTAAFTASSAYDPSGSAAGAEAAFTGDVAKAAGSFATTVQGINGTALAGLATGILKNTITTGIPSIAVAGTDYQAPISLTTTGTGAATFAANVLNIPTYTLPTATTSVLGGVKPDGTTITISGGVITAVGGGGGSGSVTSFSSGNLSPLFTTSVATGTTTPALSFALSNAAQNSVLAGPASGGAGAPSYQTAPTISAANMTSFPTLNQNTTGTAAGVTGGAVGSLPYQSAVNTTSFIASPTTTGHTFVPAWQPSGSAIAPTTLDLATYLSAPPSIGSITPGSGAFTTFSATGAVTLGNLNGDYYVNVNSPSSCTVNSVAYTTAFDCAFATAKAWISSGSDSAQINPTLHVQSNGLFTTNVGIQEPTASGNHATVNVVGGGIGGAVLQLTGSLASGVCMFTQPPEASAFNYATMTVTNLTLNANNNADCIMQINGVSHSSITHVLGYGERAGSGHIGFQFGPSNATTSTVFETFVDDVVMGGLGGGYTPAIITCTVSSGNPVCTVSDGGSYPSGTFSVQVHGVGNGSGPCSVYPAWTPTGTTTLTGLTATGGTCVAPLYVSVTPAPPVDYNFLFGPGFTDSTVKDIRAIEASAFAGIKVTGHPNTFIHPHCYVGQYACVEDYGGSDFTGLEADGIGGYAVVSEGNSNYSGIHQIYNNFQRYAGSALIYVDQGVAANVGITVSGVTCNGNRQNQGGYHNLVIGTGLPYANTSSAGGAQDAGFAVPAQVQMDNILNCSSSPTTNTVTSHIGSWSSSGSISTGTAPTACSSATGCMGFNEASTAGSPTAGQDYIRADSTSHTLKFSVNGGTETSIGSSSMIYPGAGIAVSTGTAWGTSLTAPTGTVTGTIASGTATLGTSAIASAACATVVTVTATGVATTDAITWNPNASIKAVAGYTPSTSGGLTIAAYPTANAVNYDVCNWTSASITPGAVTLNWRVTR